MPGGLLVLVLVFVAACGGAASPATESPSRWEPPVTKPLLHLNFDDLTADFDTLLPGVVNVGVAEVRVEIATAHAGRVRLAPDPAGRGAARFPGHSEAADHPAAALVVWEVKGGALSPGKRDFTFGAAFNLDDVSEGGEADNGDNVVQRGLFADAQQFKLQVDHGVPSCRIAGTDGAVVVKWAGNVTRGKWMAATCTRQGRLVRLTLWDVASGRSLGTVQGEGDIGALHFDSTTPFGVGAKVLEDGRVSSSSDQFNGVIDEVYFDVQ